MSPLNYIVVGFSWHNAAIRCHFYTFIYRHMILNTLFNKRMRRRKGNRLFYHAHNVHTHPLITQTRSIKHSSSYILNCADQTLMYRLALMLHFIGISQVLQLKLLVRTLHQKNAVTPPTCRFVLFIITVTTVCGVTPALHTCKSPVTTMTTVSDIISKWVQPHRYPWDVTCWTESQLAFGGELKSRAAYSHDQDVLKTVVTAWWDCMA